MPASMPNSFAQDFEASPFPDLERVQPKDPILLKAEELFKLGQGEKAATILEEYLKLKPDSWEANVLMADISLRLYSFLEAQKYLEDALRLNPTNATIAAKTGHLFYLWATSPFEPKTHLMPRAEEHLKQAMGIDDNNPAALTYMAEWLLNHGDFVGAERYVLKARTNDPDFIDAYHVETKIHIQQNNLARARNAIVQGLERDPKNAMSFFLTAKMLGFADHPADAVHYARRSEQLDYGELPERDYFLAEQFEKLGELELAKQYYERLLKYHPGHTDTLYRMGQISAQLENQQDARKYMGQAFGQDPSLRQKMLDGARMALLEGNGLSAIKKWRDVYQADPGNEDALGLMVALHYNLYRQGIPQDTLVTAGQVENALRSTDTEWLSSIQMKLAKTQNETMPPVLQGHIKQLTLSQDPFIRGENFWLLEQLGKAQQAFDEIDGLRPDEYLRYADILRMDGEKTYSTIFYHRALELDRSPFTEKYVVRALKAMKQEEAQAELAEQKADYLFDEGKYDEAVKQYKQALNLNMQSTSTWLRLAETYEEQKNRIAAVNAYEVAIDLNPSLMDAEGFSKKYEKLKKKAAKDRLKQLR